LKLQQVLSQQWAAEILEINMISMTTISLALMLITVILVLYALVVSRQKPLMVFLIIPFFVYTVFYTWNVINYFKGYPLYDLPTEEQVQVVSVKVNKPSIYIIIAEPGHAVPRYYIIPYTESNEKQFKGLQSMSENGVILQGQFKKAPGGGFEYDFEMKLTQLPLKEPF